MRNQYTVSELIRIAYSWMITKIFYNKARLIRRPFYIRGKSSLQYGNGLTTGYGCRFDLVVGNIKTLIIGDNCEIGDYVHIVSHVKVEIGDNCLMASKIFISDTNHGNYSDYCKDSAPDIPPNARPLYTNQVKIGNNVWIGENVCILPGVTVGDGCIIGANSVVNTDVPANSIAVGSPAKIIKVWDTKLGKWIKLTI